MHVSKASHGQDQISDKMLKATAASIAAPVTNIQLINFNLMFPGNDPTLYLFPNLGTKGIQPILDLSHDCQC